MKKTIQILIMAALVMAAASCGSNKYVEINGVKWATSNVGEKGKFVDNPEDRGGYYSWEEAQTACPKGWRVPINEEWKSLYFNGKPEKVKGDPVTQNGTAGFKFTVADTDKSVFLPASGYGPNSYVGSHGNYWSATQSKDSRRAFNLCFDIKMHGIYLDTKPMSNTFTVRCVKED